MALVPINHEAEVAVCDDNVLYNIQNQVISRLTKREAVLQSNNMLQLKKQLMFMQSCMPVEKIEQQLSRDANGKITSQTINLQKRKSVNLTYYNVGLRVEGGLINFYTVDICSVRYCDSTSGKFLTFESENYNTYYNVYQNIMASTLQRPFVMITKTKVYSVGAEIVKKMALLQKMYVAKATDNEETLSCGELKPDKMLNITPMTLTQFDNLFKFKNKKSTDSHDFVVAAVIKGVNAGLSRDDWLMIDGSAQNNAMVYTLNVVPEIFIYFEKNVTNV